MEEPGPVLKSLKLLFSWWTQLISPDWTQTKPTRLELLYVNSLGGSRDVHEGHLVKPSESRPPAAAAAAGLLQGAAGAGEGGGGRSSAAAVGVSWTGAQTEACGKVIGALREPGWW